MTQSQQTNRWAVHSLRLGVLSLFLGPLTGVPAIAAGFLGLRDLTRTYGPRRGEKLARVGILTGVVGAVFLPVLFYLMAVEVIWPNVGTKVDLIFRDVEAEHYYERRNGMWPTFRAVAPESYYRHVEDKWFPDPGLHVVTHRSIDFATGRMINYTGIAEAIKPIVAMGKVAVPHLFKWVRHDDIGVPLGRHPRTEQDYRSASC